jgi:hypothetical protein
VNESLIINGRHTADPAEDVALCDVLFTPDGFHGPLHLFRPRGFAAAYWQLCYSNWRRPRSGPGLDPRDIVQLRQRFKDERPEELAKLVKLNYYEVLNKTYMSLDPVEEWSPWVPKQPLIDWVTLAGPALEQWRKRFGDRTPTLPAVLVLPDWWRKELGDRWGWDLTKWVTGPVTLVGGNGVKDTFDAPRWQWLPGKWAPLEWSQVTDPKGLLAQLEQTRLLAHLAPLPAQGLKINTDWTMPWTQVLELVQAAERQLKEWQGKLGRFLFSEWLRTPGTKRYSDPPKYRPAAYSVMSQSLRASGTPQSLRVPQSLRASGQLDWEAACDRAMSFNFLSAFRNFKVLQSFLNTTSIERLRRDLDRFEKALDILIPQAGDIDSSIYKTTQTISTGSFRSPSSSSAVANSTTWMGDPPTDAAIAQYDAWKHKPKPAHWGWKDLSNRRKNLWGCNDSTPDDDFHDRTRHQATLLPKESRDSTVWREKLRAFDLSLCVSEERDDELAAKFKAHAADLEAQRREHDERVKLEEKNPIEFSEALEDEWNKRLDKVAADAEAAFTKDKKLGIEHTGLETLGLEELRSLKYRKSRVIPRYKNELAADLDKEEEDDEAEELPDEDAVPDEDEVVSDVEEVEPEDDKTDDDSEESESFSESGSETSEGTCYTNDPRFSDDEDAMGPPEGHDHLIPDHEDNLRKTHEERQYTHEELEYVRRHIDRVKKDDRLGDRKRLHIPAIVHETIFRNRTPEEALDICGVDVDPKTAQKQKERFVEEAEMLKDSPDGVPYVEMDDEMLDDLKAGAAYVLLDLDNGWKYHCLDTETYATLDAAVKALKESKIRAAWRESDLRKRTQRDFIRHKDERRLELQKIRDRFEQRFKDAHVYRDPNLWPRSRSWRGLLGDLASRAGEE